MTTWWQPLLIALGTVLAAVVAGSFAVRNARKTPHETLKTLVEIADTAVQEGDPDTAGKPSRNLVSPQDMQVLHEAIHREIQRISRLNDARIEGFWEYQRERLRQYFAEPRLGEFRYSFICYAYRDRDIASPLTSAIERLARRLKVAPRVKALSDETSLSAGAAIWSSIEANLARASSLIVLLSPEAATSRGVELEIRWWLEHRSVDDMILVLMAGTLHWNDASNDFDGAESSALPPSLLGSFSHEPLWVPLSRPVSPGDLDRAAMDIVAATLHISKADLVRDAMQISVAARRRLVTMTAVLLCAILAVAATAFWF